LVQPFRKSPWSPYPVELDIKNFGLAFAIQEEEIEDLLSHRIDPVFIIRIRRSVIEKLVKDRINGHRVRFRTYTPVIHANCRECHLLKDY